MRPFAFPSKQDAQLFFSYLWQQFSQNKSFETASILSYTTLLSLVPLLAVFFSLIAAFPSFQDMQNEIRDFLFQNFVPTSGEVLQSYLESFVNKAKGLTSVGIAGVVLTALMMMGAIDKAINRIWQSRQKRNKIQGFVLYWAVLTLAPLLIGVSFAITSYLFSLPYLQEDENVSYLRQKFLAFLPYFAETGAFAFIYLVVPNQKVRIKHALAGGALAALLFELAKKGFTFFIKNFASYQAIYGALATIPIFLIWIYLSWSVVLLGAEFAHALGHFREGKQRFLSDPAHGFLRAFRVLGRMQTAFRSGDVLARKDLLTLEPGIDDLALRQVLADLSQANLVRRVGASDWTLARDLSEFTLYDLMQSKPYPLPVVTSAWQDSDEWNQRLSTILMDVTTKLREPLVVPLADLYHGPVTNAQSQNRQDKG